jgi:3D (Asp-Asp-Asp) domain-containing protein
MYSGLGADRGAVAVDPGVIPLGSVVWVEGIGYCVALDTGSDIQGNRIDVFMADVDKASEWGSKTVKVRVYE